MSVEFSIYKQIGKLEPLQQKDYIWTMATHGLELGFGRQGRYPAHAHRNMADIIFSPQGLAVGNSERAGSFPGTLIVALPRTWIGTVITDAFFFMKFYCDPARTGVPDKVVDRHLAGESAGALVVTAGATTALIPLFRSGPASEPDAVAEISLEDRQLSCKLTGLDSILVTP